MSRYSDTDKILLVELFIENQKCFRATIRKFATIKGLKSKSQYPAESTVRAIVKKFYETGNVAEKARSGRPSCSGETVDKVREAHENGCSSLNAIHMETNIPKSTCRKIMRSNLGLYPYKVQIGQSLSEEQKKSRLKFCAEFLRHDFADDCFVKNILWSDEACFGVNGHVNRQNFRFWGKEKPAVAVEISKFSPKITVFAAVSSSFLLGPYFFEENQLPTTVNGVRYLQMLENFLIPELKKRRKLTSTRFQQDGATAHITKPVKEFLTAHFGNRIISRMFNFEWPANSPDLSPLDYWLWGHIKTLVYANGRPQSMADLKNRIQEAFSSVTKEECFNAVNDIIVRLEICQELKGDHFEQFV